MAEVCPQCGAELPPDAPAGVCPKCVLALAAGSEGIEASAETTPYRPDKKFIPPNPPELALHFPQLEILELIGQGGMGAVYKARQRHLNRFVALKILPPEVAQTPGFAERFQREAQALAQLSHPHIVAVYDFGQASFSREPPASAEATLAGGSRLNGQSPFYFLMEFVDGVNLRQLLRDKKLEPREALAIVPQICEALQYAHDEGIVHRDIKPENILIDKKGRVKIADFGLAKLLGHGVGQPFQADALTAGSPVSLERLTYSGQVMGTPHYMAPEQMERPLTVDHRADIYSLGVVFYEMLTGELPLGRFAPPSQKVRVDVRLDEIVLRSLEKEPERRYQHASDVKTDVESISHSPASISPVETTPHNVGAGFDYKAMQSQLMWQAKGLIISGGVGVMLSLGIMLVYSIMFGLGIREGAFPFWVLWMQLTLPIGLTIIVGGENMYRLHAYGSAVTAGILAMLPCHLGWFIGLPAGALALLVLRRPQVKAAFRCDDPRMHKERPITRENIVFALAVILVFALISGGFLLWGGRRLGQSRRDPVVDPKGLAPGTETPKAAGGIAYKELDTLDAKQSAPPPADPFPPPTHVAFGAGGKTLIALVGLHKHSWELPSGKPLGRKPIGKFIFGTKTGVLCPDGVTMTLVRHKGDVELWDIEKPGRLAGFKPGSVAHAVSNPLRAVVVVAPGDLEGTVELWQVPGGKRRDSAQARSPITALAYAWGGDWVAAGCADGSVFLWAPSVAGKNRLRGLDKAPVCLAFGSLDMLAAGDGTGSVILWDISTGQQVARLGPHPGLTAVAFAPDGRLIATGSTDGTVKLWARKEPKPNE